MVDSEWLGYFKRLHHYSFTPVELFHSLSKRSIFTPNNSQLSNSAIQRVLVEKLWNTITGSSLPKKFRFSTWNKSLGGELIEEYKKVKFIKSQTQGNNKFALLSRTCVRILDMDTIGSSGVKPQVLFSSPHQPFLDMAILNSKELVTSGTRPVIWDIETGAKTMIQQNFASSGSLECSSIYDCNTFATLCKNGSESSPIVLYDRRQKEIRETIEITKTEGNEGDYTELKFMQNTSFISLANKSAIYLMDLRNPSSPTTISKFTYNHDHESTFAARNKSSIVNYHFSLDESTLYVSLKNGDLKIWNISNEKDFFTLASPLAAQNESWGYSALTSDGKYLMNQNTGGKWLLYDISKSHLYLKEMASMTDKISFECTKLGTCQQKGSDPLYLDFNHDSTRLAAISGLGNFTVYSLTDVPFEIE